MDTIYSLSGEVPPAGAVAQAAEASVLQPGALVVGSVRQICLIRKLSAGGAVLHADLPVGEGRRLELELETGEQLDGTIAWRHGSELGLRFDEPLDVLPILARNLASQPGERRRMPRVELVCPALLETDADRGVVTIRDIAQGGARIETPCALGPEQRVRVTPEGLRTLKATVRWVSGPAAGIAFDPELAWQELMPWLRARHSASPPELVAPPPSIPILSAPSSHPQRQEGSVQLSLPARVREGTRRWTIDVTSLSARTVEFDCYAALRLGTLLWIVLPGLEGWPARIVAIEGYRFTCEFTQPLHPAVLERILAIARGER
ncbi:MAG: PilZ domain-containing protein [Pseudomonadota bacterium]|nr:PilZ domain-containing protein [Pseudomonadota bacterium]